MKGIVTRKEEITPERAEEILLRHNTRNRGTRLDNGAIVPSKHAAARYATAMKRGEWKFTHQGVAFDEEGVLLDGATRLLAVVMAGMPQEFLVTYNLPKETQLIVDAGVRRRASDWLQLEHGSFFSKNVTSAARIMIVAPKMEVGRQLTPQSLKDFIEANMPALEFAVGLFVKGQRGITVATVFALFARAYYHLEEPDRGSKLGRFAEVLRGEECNGGVENNALRFREYLKESEHGFNAAGRAIAYRKGQFALAKYIAGEKVTRLTQEERDLFPLPPRKNVLKNRPIVEPNLPEIYKPKAEDA